MFRSVRGMKDLYGSDAEKYHFIFTRIKSIGERYGFSMIHTPLLENTDVFQRSIGDETDVVSKEMYTFLDKGGESMTLRPEGTAGVIRAIVSENLTQRFPVKYMYCGEMFRYDRPQKGRFRQFRQIGFEYIGDKSPYTDVMLIMIASESLHSIGIFDFNIMVNTLGDEETRENYTKAIVKYLSRHEESLSDDSKLRLKKNPLRILDSKDKQDVDICSMAPSILDYLNKESRQYFEKVCTLLESCKIKYEINNFLVRGLDYYSHTAFEIQATGAGYREALGGGGRYDKLLPIFGGPDVSGVGFAIGIERLMLIIKNGMAFREPVRIAVIPVNESENDFAFKVYRELQECGIGTDFIQTGNLSKKMKTADRLGSKIAVILGETEIESGIATIKIMDSPETASKNKSVSISKLAAFLKWNIEERTRSC
ncbi:MAG: histidine--tRNA ligase [Holosporales bacterium]|nr:histidine--tRNA ligase [Holosporales bacterium]